MALQEPKSMDECVYFTNRFLDKNGFARAWVLKEKCPKCGKAIMGKPKDEKTGKVKIRATEYKCPSCGYTEEQQSYEDKLTINIKYKCPYCSFESEVQLPFKRKKAMRFNEETQKKESIETIRFKCGKCSKDIDITKKMK